MQVQRCPECGMRLKTNYCDICMRKVPFKGVPTKRTWQHIDGSSAHRAEKHECISFDIPAKKTLLRKPAGTAMKWPKAKTGSQTAKVAAIVIAVLSAVSSLFGLIDSVAESEAEPEYNYEAYVLDADVPQITSTELYNDGEIVITADSAGLYYEDYAISFTVQNDTQQDIMVTTDSLSVNGYMLTSGLYAPAGAGESCQGFLILDPYELQEANITQVASIEFCLLIYDAEDYTDIATSELITLQTDVADGYVQPVDDSGWELYHDGGVRVVLRSMELSSYGACDLDVYIENLSQQTVSVSTSAIQIDGEEASGYLWSSLRPDTRTIGGVYIYELEELEITELSQIEEITLELHIEYMEDWYVEKTVNEAITFSPEVLRPYMN